MPLVDVVLVLLIVFMITVPAIVGSAPIKVDLPETVSTAMGTTKTLPLHLFLRRDEDGQSRAVPELLADQRSRRCGPW